MIARRCLTLSAVALTLAGCGGEWAPSNPYDPDSPVQLRIVGPTVADALDDTVTFRLETTPAWQPGWPPLQVSWSSGDGLTSLGDGRFVVVQPSGTWTVQAKVGKRVATFPLLVQRLPVRIEAFWCAAYNDTTGTTSVSTFGPISLCRRYYDRRGFAMDGALAAAQPLDTSLISMSLGPDGTEVMPATITPRADGTTAFRVTPLGDPSSTLVDTARLIVRQRINGVVVAPCGRTIAVGDTLRLTAQAVDAAGVPYQKPPTSETWRMLTGASQNAASITPDGFLTGIGVGDYEAFVNVVWSDEGINWTLSCSGSVR